jgi:hypothetical protein
MSFKIKKDDLTIEVETEAELNTVLQSLGTKRQSGVSLRPSDFTVDIDILRKVYSNIPEYSKARKLILLLNKFEGYTSKEEIIKELSIESVQALGGALGVIGRHAGFFGLSSHDIIDWKQTITGVKYKLTDNMKKAISDLNKQRPE